MLRFLRKYSSSTGIKILYGTLAALFIIWGVGAVGGDQIDVVARVHDAQITRRDLEQTSTALQRRYEEMLRDRFTGDLARSLDVRGQALEQLIDQALLRHEAARLGLTVGDGEVVDAITHMPELQDGGRFDRERLEVFLRDRRDRGEFENDVRQDLLFRRLRGLVSDGVQVSDAEVEQRYRLDRDRVVLDFVRIPAAERAKAVTLSDEDLTKHLDENAARYQEPTRVRARYVVYHAADFLPGVEVTEGEIAEFYELEKDERFTEPERLRARHILVRLPPGADEAAKTAARTKADDLLAKLKAGGDFAALAKKSSEDPTTASKGGDLGTFARGKIETPFEDAAFALEPGQLSDLVETPRGFHIIKLEERLPAGARPLDAVRDEITAALKARKAAEQAHKEAEATRKRIVGGTALAEAAPGRSVVETPPFTADGEVPGLGPVKAFTETAFALDEGEVSDLVEWGDAIYLLSPFERVEAHTPPLDAVRERVATDARRQRGETAAKDEAEKILARAREIGLAKAAAEAGVAIDQTEPFDRRTPTVPKIGVVAQLGTDALSLTPEAPLAPKVYSAGGDAVVAALRERLAADMAGFEAEKDSLTNSILQQRRASTFSAYVNFLKERAQREGELEVEANALAKG
jgi:peptidyl-prolyl cis-trans isomerase D